MLRRLLFGIRIGCAAVLVTVGVPIHHSLYKSIHPKQEINDLYKQGQELDTDKFDYEMQVVSVKCNVRELQRMMEHTGKSKELMAIIQSVGMEGDGDA